MPVHRNARKFTFSVVQWCSARPNAEIELARLLQSSSDRATPSPDTTAAGFSNRDPLAMREPAALVCCE